MDVDAFLVAVRGLAAGADRLVRRLRATHGRATGEAVLNVHAYALPAFEAFLRRRYADKAPRVAVLPMNPGKFGAVQTGIPFTDVPRARRLVPGFDGLVDRRAVDRLGLKPHGEQSGRRFHAWGERRFGSETALLGRVAVLLTCPIAILTAEPPVRNVPIEGLPKAEREACLELVAEHTPRLFEALDATGVMCMGRWGELCWQRMREAGLVSELPAARCLHPAAHVRDAELFRSFDAAYDAVAP